MTSGDSRSSLGHHVPVDGPYIGLRPYEEDQQDLFFGRQTETGLLENKTLATPVTVLVAPSGAGKTSLLKAGVLPRLRKLDGDIIFFDAWTNPPLPAIRRKVADTFGVATSDHASVLDLCRQRAQEQSERLIILILDQFEQFFVRHEHDSDAMGREIGALARSTLDVHVVIVLRQEYLARLDAFRAHFLTVSRTAHQLGPLTSEQAREAICGPLPRFEGKIDDGLVSTLIEDLQDTGETEGLSGAVSSTKQISLPFLQIVCSRLWAEANARGSRHLTAALYDELGGRDRIVEDYVEKVVEELSPPERLDTARVLRLLAPRAGVKMAYAVQDLAAPSGLDPTRVRDVLKHLERHSIVHVRDSGTVAELFHDVFTRVLRSFIDGEIARAERREASIRRRRRIIAITGGAVVVLAGLFGGLSAQLMAEPKLMRRALSDALARGDCRAIDQALHRLWKKKAGDELIGVDRLVWGSRQSIIEDLLETVKGQAEAAARCAAPLRVAANLDERGAAIVLRYNDDTGPRAKAGQTSGPPIEVKVVQSLWKRLTTRVWDENAVPIAAEIDVVADETLPPSSYVVEVDDRVVLRRTIPSSDRVAVVVWNSPERIQKDVRDISRQVAFERRRIAAFDERSLLLGMAHGWSTVVWQVIGQHHPTGLEVLPGRESAMAFDALETFVEHPELYLTESFTRALLASLQDDAPCLVYAALDRFNPCDLDSEQPADDTQAERCRQTALKRMLPVVHETLVEAAKHGQPSGVLTRVLDHLADVPRESAQATPRAVVRWLLDDAGRGWPPEPISLSRHRQRDWGCPKVDFDLEDVRAPWDLASAMIKREALVRVRLGEDALDEVVSGVQLRPEVIDAVSAVRRALNPRFGVFFPGVRFVDDPGKRGFRIDLVGAPVVAQKPGDSVLDDLRAGLLQAGSERRAALITVDGTVNPFRFQDFNRLYLYGWLESRFTRNDIKLLLRGVLGTRTIPEPSIRYAFPWLLGSLVFWDAACAPRDGNCLVQRLDDTARALRDGADRPAAMPHAITRGIDALVQDDPDQAALQFAVAWRKDPTEAQTAFLHAYSASAKTMWLDRTNRLCAVPEPGAADGWGTDSGQLRIDIEDAIDLLPPESGNAAHLQLCTLMHRLPTDDGATDAQTVVRYLADHVSQRELWSVSERYWLAFELVNANARARKPSPAARKAAQELIAQVFTPGALDPEFAGASFERLLNLCSESKSDTCLWDLADTVREGQLAVPAKSIILLASELFDLENLQHSGAAGTHRRTAEPGIWRARACEDRGPRALVTLHRASGPLGRVAAPHVRPR